MSFLPKNIIKTTFYHHSYQIRNRLQRNFSINLDQTMKETEVFKDLTEMYQSGIKAVLPSEIIYQNVKLKNNIVSIRDNQTDFSKGCYAIGFGKAALGMTLELERILSPKLRKGIVCVPIGVKQKLKPTEISEEITILEGAKNNLPDETAVRNAHHVIEFIDNLEKDAIIFILISGGGSALLPYPKPPITLEEKLSIIKMAVATGANIQDLNAIRSRLSLTKGGGLAKIAYPRKLIALILSDVVGDDLCTIASGPTSVLPINNVEEILNRLKLKVPEYLKKILLTDDSRPTIPVENNTYINVENHLIGTNQIALKATYRKSISLNYHSVIITSNIQGLVEHISKTYVNVIQSIYNFRENRDQNELLIELTEILRNINLSFDRIKELHSHVIKFDPKNSKGICLIFGGETTVIVKGSGLGGRNQQLALQFSIDANRLIPEKLCWFLSVGTDGIDGPTDAAGAIGFPSQIDIAESQQLIPSEFIEHNNSYEYYSKLANGKYLIKTGHTGTNVADIHILIII